ncbi:MAG: ATP-dependent DNA helicase RecG [Pirellulales bacterium]|nr:ATP-dependent DNA helicase RecG [Pirellulales bacterium]
MEPDPRTTPEPPLEPRSAADLLATPVQFLKGVGPRRAFLFERLGLRTALDVLFFFPRDYQDLSDLRRLDQLEEDVLVSVLGHVEDIDAKITRGGRSVLSVLLRDERGLMRALWFNLPYLRERFQVGQQVMFSGKPRLRENRWEMVHPRIQWIDDDDTPRGRILPVYPLTEGLNQGQLRRIVEGVLAQGVEVLDEVFPPEYLQAHWLAPLREALYEVHFPTSQESLARARRRFIYQELLVLQLALAVKRRQLHDTRIAPALPADARIDARIRRRFDFELTADQQQAIADIARDMAQTVPMNRLLQGDVGSGKTVVAVYAMLLTVAHGHQAALMAPTEVLARQHFRNLERLLAGSQVRCGLLLGSLPAARRAAVLAAVAAGEIQLLVGTQAIVQGEVLFSRLGLVVIDEQHKFGVLQRASLKQAGPDPHYLVMTATPIPRTIAMTLFGDLDVSTLRQAPPGRQPVHTYLATAEQRAPWWEFVRKQLRTGRQGYVVAPLVDESDELEAKSVETLYEELTDGELAAFRVGMIHGRMTAPEKEAVMESFAAGRTQVLVSTTVIEVGVDVPNATLMTIEAGERFGLSQLHQLRGRVSRGSFPGYCCVFADPTTDEGRQRLDAFVKTTDGFELAELDFRLRGPGDLLGTRQHGVPPLRIADLERDTELLTEARRDALDLVAADPGLARPEHERLRKMVLVRYGRVLELGDVG